MPSLSKEYRKLLENTVVSARQSAVSGARKALTALRVGDKESPTDPDQKALRAQLRAHGRQLGDIRQPDGTQETRRLEQACAYEHWHRLLFARFLAENNLLVNPEYGVAMSLAEVQETAREQNRDWLSLASDHAQRMLLEVFRPDDPVLRLTLPPETRQEFEILLAQLHTQIFIADDSLGWVYQFWQRDEKERVNKLDVKIGADELSSVTQLFTEDYMVLFLLHNTLGAWWTAKRRAEGKAPNLPGYEWTYLRLNDDGSPTAGSFDGWGRNARDLRILDPCMGSGHFLTFALPIIGQMRQLEENLSTSDAVKVALAENLFGLELDARCSQIAAFNLALTAWRIVGQPIPLPPLNLACSGLGINANEDSWLALAGEDRNVRFTLGQCYKLFQKAPTLGSLIDPTRDRRAFIEFDRVWPLVEKALAVEQENDESRELAIAAKGVLSATRMLAEKFTLVATNVPYLGRGKQAPELARYCQDSHSDSKADLATCFIDRCLRFCTNGGSVALVTPQNWLFQQQYRHFRERLLKEEEWRYVSRLGPRAFEMITGEVVQASLVCITHSDPQMPGEFVAWDVREERSAVEKAHALVHVTARNLSQQGQLDSPDCRIALAASESSSLLEEYATAYSGMYAGDSLRFDRFFWEVPENGTKWDFVQSTVDAHQHYGGRSGIVLWEQEHGQMFLLAQSVRHLNHAAQNWLRGKPNWGKRGVVISQTGNLSATLYLGEKYDLNCCAIVPNDPSNVPALWAYCSSPEFLAAVRNIDQALKVTSQSLLKVPFDLAYWQSIAIERYPEGLPSPNSNDPSQWLFDCILSASTHPLQVAVARLAGYRWPRQVGATFIDCAAADMDGLEVHEDSDGIVCLASIAGEPTAAERIRALLADAFGVSWSSQKLADCLGASESLDLWLRDKFFEEHCSLFQRRPFVWHVWDGRKDGFHALVNYHKLAAPNGQGRRVLEKLIYSALGDWIGRQQADVTDGADGAEARLGAALHLQSELEKILEGQPPYDLFIRWKPLHAQPMGWEPDLSDGVRVNIRPWLYAKPYLSTRSGTCILRITPVKLPLGKDRGKELFRDKDEFPWFAASQDRSNDEHFTLEQKLTATERKKNI